MNIKNTVTQKDAELNSISAPDVAKMPADILVVKNETEEQTVATEATEIDDGVDELPPGAVIVGELPTELANSDAIRPDLQAAFTDEHAGKGGTYVIGDDGVRRPAYEAYKIPAPGSRGERGELVTKYRPAM